MVSEQGEATEGEQQRSPVDDKPQQQRSPVADDPQQQLALVLDETQQTGGHVRQGEREAGRGR